MSTAGLYEKALRPVLFRMGGGDAETAHHRTLTALTAVGRTAAGRRALRVLAAAPATPVQAFGLSFPGVVGLAAGMDKNGTAVRAWPALGFGHVEVGTVTAQPQPGNDRPRLFRLPESRALINRMGFNNAGAAALARTLRAAGPTGVPIGVSLGKSKVTPLEDAVGDYLSSLRAVVDVADYVAVNVSSPNTPGLRALQDRGPLDELLDALTVEARRLSEGTGRAPVPVLVKIAPDLTDEAVAQLLEVCQDRGVSGVIATNTTLSRDGVAGPEQPLAAAQAGGLSGRPLAARAAEVVAFVTRHTDLPVIGVGGIGEPDDALAMLDAGATLLQVYTGFIYAGPALVGRINRAVADRAGQHIDPRTDGSPR
ncbi:quinone-dependent dihydroorotate dehydrogenase [Nakamurella leprariae]|uniref:Dihydroorotate dehydrogenase (quinone) n=1 Tax=Nakamurella leprariae TaxID=2803911 RepID=A0A938YI52_9ACTN|nr:quinone-dependent dihydroorotate dehydrogenase [Nakamurella leprariae]MBM9468230.1 quinone-dependent dihydroorotate dehydrogenase [Nakamurella leprariae]